MNSSAHRNASSLADDASYLQSPIELSSLSGTDSSQCPEDSGQGDDDSAEDARLLQSPASLESQLRYAKAEILSKYIPEVNRGNPRSKTFRSKISKRSTMLKIQLGISFLVVIINIGATIWAVADFPPDSRGVGTFAFGNCHNNSLLNSALHMAINVLSSLILGSGNYCMQLLVGPSRHEMDEAHSKGVSLEIGVASIKNLRHIERKRIVVWVFLSLFSTVLHFFWNSAVFASVPIVSVPRAVVTSDFQTATDNWTATDPLVQRSWWSLPSFWGKNVSYDLTPLYQMQTTATNMTRLEPLQCINRFIDPLTSTQDLMLVASNVSSYQNNGSSLIDGWMSGWDLWTVSQTWICGAYPSNGRACTQEWAESFANNWIVPGAPLEDGPRQNVTVDYCLVGEAVNTDDKCGLHYSVYIMALVCTCTLLEAMLICLTWLIYFKTKKSDTTGKRGKTMVTMGDAIAEFLERPDDLAVMDNTGTTIPETVTRASCELSVGRWREERMSWFKAADNLTWGVSLTIFALGVAIPSYSIISSINWLKHLQIPVNAAKIWQQGFKPHWTMVMAPLWGREKKDVRDFLIDILIANSFQVGVSFIYFFYNNILTRQLLSDEWMRFIQLDGKKPLRVSSPEGMQRSSYSLSLPFKYSIPLMACSILLHWLISQSIFLVQTSSFDPGPEGHHNPAFDVSARGYSILGTTLAISTGLILILALFINARVRKYQGIPSGFQRMATNSAAISLMCLRPEADTEAHHFPVQIGAVTNQELETKGLAGHIVFSTDIGIKQPEAGGMYLMPQLVQKNKGSQKGFMRGVKGAVSRFRDRDASTT